MKTELEKAYREAEEEERRVYQEWKYVSEEANEEI